MDENAIRAGWKTGATCQIYSNSKKKWFQGEVAQIFTDEEGEWLEVRYDKSMSKQVQRYSSDIRPHPDDTKKKSKKANKKNDNVPFPDQEMKIRQAWDKGDEVEIFSNSFQEWYLGEVVDIIKDDEGEWLNCVWARANGEAMSKQVQRFSTDVRPVQDDNSSSGSSSDDGPSPKQTQSKPMSQAEKTQALSQKIQQRKQNFRRRAPPFSRTLRPSTFTYPATSSARRSRKLLDLEETLEKNQHVVDQMPMANNKNNAKRIDIESMKPQQVREFIRSLGKAYLRYESKFRNISGRDLLKYNETALSKLVSPKLHRNKILLEISKNSPSNQYAAIFNNNVDVLNWNTSKVKEWCGKTQVISIYAQKFFNHGIDGMLLFELDSKDLTTIGVKKIHQQRVLDIITKFAKQNFPSSPKDDEKEVEPDLNGNGLSISLDQEKQGKRKRGSVATIDTSQLQYNGINGGVQNNDAIIYTMGELLLELGQMFKNAKVQDLTSRLQRQLNELQDNSTHPQMLKRGSLKVDTNDHNDENGEDSEQALILKMQDRVDTSPTGVDAAWIKTQTNAKGHKRRSSLPYINTNVLDDDEDEDDISDIE